MTEQERIEYRFLDIQSLLDNTNIEFEDIKFIAGGKTNESFLITSTDRKKYLARISGKGTDAFIDRSKELNNVKIAAKIGIAPKIICAHNNDLLLEFIDGECSTNQEILFFDENMKKLTTQLKSLHHSSERFAGQFSFIQDFNLYKEEFIKTGFSVPDELQNVEDKLYEMTKWVDQNIVGSMSPVHSDIVLQNFIFTEDRAYIIDWEYSTMADKYLDLASFCTQNILGPGVEKMFLKEYFKDNKDEFDVEKFILYKMSISFMWIYWHLNNVAHNKDFKYNDYRWKMHLNNANVCAEGWEELQKKPSTYDHSILG